MTHKGLSFTCGTCQEKEKTLGLSSVLQPSRSEQSSANGFVLFHWLLREITSGREMVSKFSSSAGTGLFHSPEKAFLLQALLRSLTKVDIIKTELQHRSSLQHVSKTPFGSGGETSFQQPGKYLNPNSFHSV